MAILWDIFWNYSFVFDRRNKRFSLVFNFTENW